MWRSNVIQCYNSIARISLLRGICCPYGLLAHHHLQQAADVEARKNAEEADRRERAAEIRREERMKKIKYMQDMDDGTQVSRRRSKHLPTILLWVCRAKPLHGDALIDEKCHINDLFHSLEVCTVCLSHIHATSKCGTSITVNLRSSLRLAL